MTGRINIFMKSLAVLVSMAVPSFALRSQDKADTLVFTDAYLDTVRIEKVFSLNDYTIIGVEGGASLSRMQFNPSKTQTNLFVPGTFGVFILKYGKLFDGSPNFGFKLGARYSHEGYKFKANKETGVMPNQDGAIQAVIDVVEVPFMAHFHSDGPNFKVMADAGIYGGRRLSIERTGDRVSEDIRNAFAEWDRRFDYGLTGGVGFGIVFDPFEFHVNADVRYSWGTLFDPDYFHKDYYRFAYPLDFMLTAGLYFQLTKRTGKGKAQLRKEAYDQVYNPGK